MRWAGQQRYPRHTCHGEPGTCQGLDLRHRPPLLVFLQRSPGRPNPVPMAHVTPQPDGLCPRIRVVGRDGTATARPPPQPHPAAPHARAHAHTHTHAQMCTHPTQHRDHTPSPVRALPRTGLWPHRESQNSNLTASLMRSEPGTGQPHGWGGMLRAGGGGREVPEHPESLGPHSFCLSEGLGLQA